MTPEQIASEIQFMRERHTLPSQALLDLAIERGWFSIRLQNSIINRGPGSPAPSLPSRLYTEMIERMDWVLDNIAHPPSSAAH